MAEEYRARDGITRIFTLDGPIRYASRLEGTGFMGLHRNIHRIEVAHRMRKYMGADRESWMRLIDKYEQSLPSLIESLDWCGPTRSVKFRYDSSKDQVLRSIFEETSKAVHENACTGFSFSPVLYMAYMPILEPPADGYRRRIRNQRGRPRERPLLMHYCEGNAKKRIVMRPVNDEAKPKFFCRTCKETISPAQKTFYKLHRLGKKVI
jgi:hypothetical protein